VLDTIDQEVVAVGVIHQLRTLPLMATVVLVAETADIAEGRFHVEWRSASRLLLRSGRVGRHGQRRGQADSGSDDAEPPLCSCRFHCILGPSVLVARPFRHHARKGTITSNRRHGVQHGIGGDFLPAHALRNLTVSGCAQGRANTFRTPESLGMLFHGSPHRPTYSSPTRLPHPVMTATYCLPPAV